MSGSASVVALDDLQIQSGAVQAGQALVMRVVIPVTSGTVDEALDRIRDGVSGDRNTLAKLSTALDAQQIQADTNSRRRAFAYSMFLS